MKMNKNENMEHMRLLYMPVKSLVAWNDRDAKNGGTPKI